MTTDFAKNTTRAFLVGGPADGKVILLDGQPDVVCIPEVPPLTSRYMEAGAVTHPEPIPVSNYRRDRYTHGAHDGKTLSVYSHDVPAPPKPRDVYVILTKDRRMAVNKFRELQHYGHVPQSVNPYGPQVIAVSGRHSETKLRGLRGEHVRIIYGPGAFEVIAEPSVRYSLDILRQSGARDL